MDWKHTRWAPNPCQYYVPSTGGTQSDKKKDNKGMYPKGSQGMELLSLQTPWCLAHWTGPSPPPGIWVLFSLVRDLSDSEHSCLLVHPAGLRAQACLSCTMPSLRHQGTGLSQPSSVFPASLFRAPLSPVIGTMLSASLTRLGTSAIKDSSYWSSSHPSTQ